jgi:hypothetical protein
VIAFAILCAVLYLAALAVVWINDRFEEVDRLTAAEKQPMTWDDAALGRVLRALDETAETFAYDDALSLANDRSYDRTLAEIRALPTTGDAA